MKALFFIFGHLNQKGERNLWVTIQHVILSVGCFHCGTQFTIGWNLKFRYINIRYSHHRCGEWENRLRKLYPDQGMIPFFDVNLFFFFLKKGLLWMCYFSIFFLERILYWYSIGSVDECAYLEIWRQHFKIQIYRIEMNRVFFLLNNNSRNAWEFCSNLK